ncbi:MAG: stage II sporulation protein P [Clostridia bacterium]|nr:stage II sporulation protein P [Clostridia bacterium]
MKKDDIKKLVMPFVICCVIASLCCVGVFNLAGDVKIISACVSLLFPNHLSQVTTSDIGISLKNASFSEKNNALQQDKNDNRQTVNINSLAYTPDDIQQLIDSAKESFDEEEKGGNVISQTFGESSASQKEGNILVKNTTGRSLDISETLKLDSPLKKINKNEISVLVFHTHTTESYLMLDKTTYPKTASVRSEDKNRNMVRVGKEIVAELEKAGIGVIHDTNIYDRQYSGAYERSGAAIDEYLKKYPTIQVVLDIHRDAIQTSETSKIKPVTTINGKKAAQIMIITGCEGGDVTDFPEWEQNLRFALRLQKTAEDMYPTLMRPLFFCNRKYNMYKTKCSLLLEMGSDVNTLDEAAYSGRLIGHTLAEMLI